MANIYLIINICGEGEKMKDHVKVENISASYDGNIAIQNISFTMVTGQLIGVIGPNGAGKSTLIKAMLGLIPKNEGTVTIAGKSVKALKQEVAYVPQRVAIDWDFPITVRDTVLLGTYPHLSLFKRPRKKEKQWAMECLEKVNMDAYANRQIAELSGGQQQRVFLARALAQRASYFFLDEPFVGIDVASEKMIIELLKALRDDGKTIFVVHHDLSKVEEYFDELILINKRLIKAGPVHEVIQTDFMTKAYNMDVSLFYRVGV